MWADTDPENHFKVKVVRVTLSALCTHPVRLAGQMQRPSRELRESVKEDIDERMYVPSSIFRRFNRLAVFGIREANANAIVAVIALVVTSDHHQS